MAELPTTPKFALSWKQLFTERDKSPFDLQYLKSKRLLYNNSYTRILIYLRYEYPTKYFLFGLGLWDGSGWIWILKVELLYLQCTQTKTHYHWHKLKCTTVPWNQNLMHSYVCVKQGIFNLNVYSYFNWLTLLLFWLKFTHIFPILFSLQDTSQVTMNIYQLLNVNVLHVLHSVLKLMLEVWKPMHIHLYHHYSSCSLLLHKV